MNNKIIELYNGQVRIRFNEGNHSYWLETEQKTAKGTPKLKRLAGVTTYISIKDKPALQQWYANMSIDHIRKNLEGLKLEGADLQLFLEEARVAATNYKDAAANIGTEIHKWIEEYIRHKLDEKSPMPAMPTEQNIILGVGSFMDWVSEHKVNFIWTERVVYSKEYGFVGTADLCVEINGKKYLGDLKTSNALYPEVGMQTAGYLMALNEEDGDTGIVGRIALRVSKETEEEYMERMGEKDYFQKFPEKIPPYQVFEYLMLDKIQNTINEDFMGFKACMDLYGWNKDATKYFKDLKA